MQTSRRETGFPLRAEHLRLKRSTLKRHANSPLMFSNRQPAEYHMSRDWQAAQEKIKCCNYMTDDGRFSNTNSN